MRARRNSREHAASASSQALERECLLEPPLIAEAIGYGQHVSSPRPHHSGQKTETETEDTLGGLAFRRAGAPVFILPNLRAG